MFLFLLIPKNPEEIIKKKIQERVFLVQIILWFCGKKTTKFNDYFLLQLQVAIKCLGNERMTSNSTEFLKEAAVMHSIDHPNIVRLYGVVLHMDSLMLVSIHPIDKESGPGGPRKKIAFTGVKHVSFDTNGVSSKATAV